MMMNVYLMFVMMPDGEPRAGVLLAKDRPEALEKAVGYCKGTFGKGSKVTLIDHIATADLNLLVRTKIADLMCVKDQLIFQTTALDQSYGETLGMIDELSTYLQGLKTRLSELKTRNLNYED